MSLLNEMSSRSSGQKTIIEAKMKEFEGLLLIGNKSAADKVREESHTVLDSYFDCQAEFIDALRLGKFT